MAMICAGDVRQKAIHHEVSAGSSSHLRSLRLMMMTKSAAESPRRHHSAALLHRDVQDLLRDPTGQAHHLHREHPSWPYFCWLVGTP